MNTVSEEQVLFNKLGYEEQQFILKQMRLLQPCESICEEDNKEIKEILDNFEKYEARYRLRNETQFIITHREIQILLDYITNLQEVLDKIKEKCLSIKGNPEHTIVSKNELVKQFLELLEEIE